MQCPLSSVVQNVGHSLGWLVVKQLVWIQDHLAQVIWQVRGPVVDLQHNKCVVHVRGKCGVAPVLPLAPEALALA